MKIAESEYKQAKIIVEQYEALQLYLSRFKGKSKCPFCGGTKTVPFVRAFQNQDCKECNKNGKIANRKLAEYGLEDFIEKNKN